MNALSSPRIRQGAPASGGVAPLPSAGERGSRHPESGVHRGAAAFSLIELILVIGVIGIMASLVIASFSNASVDTRGVIARQQQVVVQNAINAWISAQSSPPGSLAAAQGTFATATTSLARLALVQVYLDDSTYAALTAGNTNANQIRSDAMVKTGQHLEITAWASGSYPKVNLVDTP